MNEGRTEREVLLEARVKELEAAAAFRQNRDASGGIFEQAWRFLSAFVPPWIIAAGLGVFLIFHGWEYYNQAQIAVAETQLTKAQAALKDATARAQNALAGGDSVRLATVKAELEKAQQEATRARVESDAQNTKIGTETVRLATVKAELEKSQQEAARAKVEADAQNSMVEDATVRLATLQAELANKQAEAAKAKAAADAANQKFGLQTLEERAATAKLVLSELDAADKRGSAAGQAALGSGGSIGAAYLKTARAICENNRYAQLINCPEEFISIAPSAPQTQVPRGNAQPDPGKPLRKPSIFDCAREWMGADYVICSSDTLLDAEARLEDVYRTAHAARGDAVKTEQWASVKRYGPACGLPLIGRPAPDQINEARGCIEDALNQRIRELQAEQ